ncbi:hypothetical protein [Rossellomorea vietnamensis]|uniref:hypothetical protein n=1 Tax=Rossellomorea vietnamensis TaxID=218284 RepID=UPI001E4F8900|nr:hypothetical protein [Rossellomorea vietnamensis]MCC5801909.1 hypothetical protein [Rossellomorea vietnamensis]
MIKLTKLLSIGVLALGLAACGSSEESSGNTESQVEKSDTSAKEESKSDSKENYGIISNYGDVEVIKNFGDFTLEGNESVDYSLKDIKLVRLSNFTDDAEMGLMWALGVESVDEFPEEIYAVTGKELKKNKTEESIEFTGVHTLAAGTEQVDMIEGDIITDDNEGSTMMAGTEQANEFAVPVKSADLDNLSFVLSAAFDSETMSNNFAEEQTFDVNPK